MSWLLTEISIPMWLFMALFLVIALMVLIIEFSIYLSGKKRKGVTNG
ncbi:hypothetical protein ACFLXT_02705 [Chloroflexota bacterium]